MLQRQALANDFDNYSEIAIIHFGSVTKATIPYFREN